MSDTLRDRIADVLLAHAENDAGPDCTCGWEWEGYGLWKDSYASHVADAILAELGLREELKYLRTFSISPPQRRRYVTDWVTDE